LEDAVGHLMNTSSSFAIRASALTFIGSSGTTSPASITLTAVRGSGLVGGTIAWSVFSGIATISPMTGNTCSVTGSSVVGASVTVRAQLTVEGQVHDAYVTLARLGAVASQDVINLTNQVTGTLSNSNVSGLGALALLNTININTQTTGSLNGATRVTNLGNLAYANAIAANQIGAGQLAAGVIYAGDVFAENVKGGSFEGESFTGGNFTGGSFESIGTASRVVVGAGPGGGGGYVRLYSTGSGAGQRVNLSGQANGESWIDLGSASHNAPAFRVSSNGNFTQPTLRIDGTTYLIGRGSTDGPLRIQPSSSLPTYRGAGCICFYQGTLCYADGTHWYRADGTQLT